MNTGVLLWVDDPGTRQEAERRALAVAVIATPTTLPLDRALVIGPGARVPWQLVKDGFQFLDHWEAAAPLLERNLAQDVGSTADRHRTAEIVRDLRVPVYASELLFVRACDGSSALLSAWMEEMGPSTVPGPRLPNPFQDDSAAWRLAFLRALYRVKPLFLALPRSWLRGAPVVPMTPTRPSRLPRPGNGMVQVEIAPGRYVCCKPEEVEKYKAQFARIRSHRR